MLWQPSLATTFSQQPTIYKHSNYVKQNFPLHEENNNINKQACTYALFLAVPPEVHSRDMFRQVEKSITFINNQFTLHY